MKNAVVAGCFITALISVGVCVGTIQPVAVGYGAPTTGVTATGVVSLLTTLLSGAGGLFALLKKSAPNVIDIAKPWLGGDQRLISGGVDFIKSLFDEHNDISEDMEKGAALLICHARSKALDKPGTDKAFELLQHIQEQHAKTAVKK
jgi:hypothetical protein